MARHYIRPQQPFSNVLTLPPFPREVFAPGKLPGRAGGYGKVSGVPARAGVVTFSVDCLFILAKMRPHGALAPSSHRFGCFIFPEVLSRGLMSPPGSYKEGIGNRSVVLEIYQMTIFRGVIRGVFSVGNAGSFFINDILIYEIKRVA